MSTQQLWASTILGGEQQMVSIPPVQTSRQLAKGMASFGSTSGVRSSSVNSKGFLCWSLKVRVMGPFEKLTKSMNLLHRKRPVALFSIQCEDVWGPPEVYAVAQELGASEWHAPGSCLRPLLFLSFSWGSGLVVIVFRAHSPMKMTTSPPMCG